MNWDVKDINCSKIRSDSGDSADETHSFSCSALFAYVCKYYTFLLRKTYLRYYVHNCLLTVGRVNRGVQYL